MSHQAGRQTDQEILALLEQRFGQPSVPPGYRRAPRPPEEAPRYTTDLQAAWHLVEWLEALGFELALMTTAKEHAQLGAWTCAVSKGQVHVRSSAATPALAISRAMLAILARPDQRVVS
ncbi:MAG TPA: hypothetical protein VEZ12_16620 [Herpetosiphonaceae bacterium]|nr:hypothetical protein [Herpetosiphonaceae bacterium]